MLINYESNPEESIIYVAAKIMQYLKFNNTNINCLIDFFTNENMNYNLIYLGLDMLFLLNFIKDINDEGELLI